MRAMVFGLLGIVLSVTCAFASDNGLVTKPSKYSVAETLTRLEGALKSKGMSIFARIDHQAEAEKVGLQIRPAQLLIFGIPKGGTPLMVASPTTAIDLPLKALAWEDASGKVWLSHNSVSYLRSRHDIQSRDDLIKNLEGALDAMTNKALTRRWNKLLLQDTERSLLRWSGPRLTSVCSRGLGSPLTGGDDGQRRHVYLG